MPAKPKRGTVPSPDGDGVDKRNTFVKRKFHFRPTRPLFRPRVKLANPHGRYVCEFPPISAHRPLRPQRIPPIYIKKILNKKIPRVYTREDACGRMGGNGRNREIRTVHTFARVSHGRNVGGNGRKRFFDCTSAREMLSHAREALRTPFPLSQSG